MRENFITRDMKRKREKERKMFKSTLDGYEHKYINPHVKAYSQKQ